MEAGQGSYGSTHREGYMPMLSEALKYAKRGWPVFPLRPNSKRPLTENGYKAGTTDTTTILKWWKQTPTANIGVCTGPSSGLVVLDVDVKNEQKGDESLRALADCNGVELPKTLISDTPSGGLHYYFKASDMDIRCSASRIGKGLDVRAAGGYIVAPPSQIEGKVYRWRNPTETIADIPNWLSVALAGEWRKSNPSKAGGRPTREGQRNNHIFDLARQLRSAGVSYDAAIEQILDAADDCDPPLPHDEAVRTLSSAYNYDQWEAVNHEIRELNKKHAVLMIGGKCRVMNDTVDPSFGYLDVTFSTTNDFRAFYGNKTVQMGTTTIRLADHWLKSPLRRGYAGIVFSPGTDTPLEGFFNLWRGFSVTPQIGDCRLFLQHIKDNIASGTEELYEYIIAWLADAVQKPADRPGTALVFRGKQGTGKGMVANQFGRIFGKHYLHLTSSNQLLGKFNGHLGEAVVVFADEAFWGGDKSAEGQLKSMITEPTLMIEKKNLDAIQVKNHVHLLVASNNDWVVPAGLEERRFLVMDVADNHQQDHAYFAAIVNEMDNGGIEALLHHLLQYDLTKVNLRELPKTKALQETKLLSMSHIHKYWYSLLQAGALEDHIGNWNGGLVAVENFKNGYFKFANDMGVRHRSTVEELAMSIKKMVPSVTKLRISTSGNRRYHYQFPSLEDCRCFFDSLFGTEGQWPAPEEEEIVFDP